MSDPNNAAAASRAGGNDGVVSGRVIRARLCVEGQVQGVGFRWFTRCAARQVGVVGWVRNRSDSSVCCEVQGAAGDVEAFLVEVRHGPPGSRVTRVVVEGLAVLAPAERDFEIMR